MTTTQGKPTSGPWTFDESNNGKCPFFGWGIIPNGMEPSPAFVPYQDFASSDKDYETTARANARLIAAAPELLAALRVTLSYVADRFGIDASAEPVWKQGQAAIAKAEGKM